MTTVRYPAKAARAIGFLKSHSNDIDIFVEDTGSPNMWLKLIRKFIPNGLKLASVTPLGGRKEVIKACKEDQGNGGRKRLYIIDADMDIITNRAKPKLKRLYRLRRYCVENYLISQNALIEVLMGLNPRLSVVSLREAISVPGWIKENEKSLRSIFTAYAVAEHLSLGVQTVSYSCHRLFIDNVSFHYCSKQVNKRVFYVYRTAIKLAGRAQVRSAYSLIVKNVNSSNVDEYCSAKDYILPAIYSKSKRIANFSVTIDSFKTMLCDHIEPSIDPYLRRRLANL